MFTLVSLSLLLDTVFISFFLSTIDMFFFSFVSIPLFSWRPPAERSTPQIARGGEYTTGHSGPETLTYPIV